MQFSLPATTKILFLSDVHLGAFSETKNRQLEQQLIELIDFAEQEHYQLAILGDLFDYWIEYPSMVPTLGKKILDRLQEFHKRAPRTLYITGNHDYWTLGHFHDRDFDVEPDYRILDIDNRKVLLAHGDATGASPEKLKRPMLHRIIRNEKFLKVYRDLFPPKFGLSIMKQFSKVSRKLGEEKTNPAKLDDWAKKMLQNNDIDLILCGHDHVARIREYNYGTYINLGTFHSQKSLAEYNNGHFSLVTWNSNRKQLFSFQPQVLTYE